jgi:diacylglycerol kinase (ATP)
LPDYSLSLKQTFNPLVCKNKEYCMDAKPSRLKFLFIINKGAGSGTVDYKEVIPEHFKSHPHEYELFELPDNIEVDDLKEKIKQAAPDRIIAIGGDGTLKLVAQCQLKSDTPIGIIPGGSANGMAKELGIPLDVNEALDTAINGTPKKIHVVMVNGELCIHLSDIGFNAYVIKKFDSLPERGMLAYGKAAWQAIWQHHKMEIYFRIDGKDVNCEAAMVVIANATMYGTGVKINPEGQLDDGVFEVILVKQYSVLEILKRKFTNMAFNPEKMELFKTDKLTIKSKHLAHFQVDGEYMGKVKTVSAHIIPDAIQIIV